MFACFVHEHLLTANSPCSRVGNNTTLTSMIYANCNFALEFADYYTPLLITCVSKMKTSSEFDSTHEAI